MENSERLKELCLQLSIAFDLDILAIQSNFLTESVASGFNSLIVSSFLKFLCMVEIISTHNHQLPEFH